MKIMIKIIKFILLISGLYLFIFIVLEKKKLSPSDYLKNTNSEKQIENINKTNNDLNERQNELLKLIRTRGVLKINEIENEFSDVSSRTIRRDFNKHELLGYVEKEGKTKDRAYRFIQKVS